MKSHEVRTLLKPDGHHTHSSYINQQQKDSHLIACRICCAVS
jgi:hypothetical protein